MGAPLGFRYVRSAQGEGDSSMVKRVTLGVLLLAGFGVAVLLFALTEARSGPVVREARIALRDWPEGAPPLRLVLVSDIHLGSPAMDGARLDRIVTQINALDPDLVVIAGDFIFGHEPGSAAMLGAGLPASLARLDAPLGTVAALGNRDHWTGVAAVREQLERAGVAVVENGAIRRGPIVLGVVGDDFTRHDDIPATLAAMAEFEGPQVVLSHSPDIAPELPPEVALVLAAHPLRAGRAAADRAAGERVALWRALSLRRAARRRSFGRRDCRARNERAAVADGRSAGSVADYACGGSVAGPAITERRLEAGSVLARDAHRHH